LGYPELILGRQKKKVMAKVERMTATIPGPEPPSKVLMVMARQKKASVV